ncbi:hypothetical protein MKZ38_007016 [Zalerion maritima]|uniref:Ribosomal protein S13 n=1 Tax=Zalerion maritima TaxID=339359 RepID=A0AAD5RWU0_9PEZI|nr:hypothetical protein MKZ38_007016 [Zalerion maritima]
MAGETVLNRARKATHSFPAGIWLSRSTVNFNTHTPGVMILGVGFHEHKLVKKALMKFYALGPTTAARMMAKYSIHETQRVGQLPAKIVTSLTGELSTMTLENDAKRVIQDNIARLKDMNSYRGRRHAMHLPVRGQRTRNQTETVRKFNKLFRTR